MVNSMEDRYDIGVDIGEGKDCSVVTLFENGEYRPIAVCDSISFADSVQRSGYVGVEAGELSFSAELVETSTDALKFLLGEYEHKTFRDLCDEAYLSGDYWALFALAMSKMRVFWGYPQSFADLNYARGLLLKLCRRKRGQRVGKTRKTTYKTIRRDCAKRNRHR